MVNTIELEEIQDKWYETKDFKYLEDLIKELRNAKFMVELAMEGCCEDDE